MQVQQRTLQRHEPDLGRKEQRDMVMQLLLPGFIFSMVFPEDDQPAHQNRRDNKFWMRLQPMWIMLGPSARIKDGIADALPVKARWCYEGDPVQAGCCARMRERHQECLALPRELLFSQRLQRAVSLHISFCIQPETLDWPLQGHSHDQECMLHTGLELKCYPRLTLPHPHPKLSGTGAWESLFASASQIPQNAWISTMCVYMYMRIYKHMCTRAYVSHPPASKTRNFVLRVAQFLCVLYSYSRRTVDVQ